MDIEGASQLVHGTTIVAAIYKDGVVIGSDSRAADRFFVRIPFVDNFCRVSKAIIIIGDGSLTTTQQTISYMKNTIELYENTEHPTKATVLYAAETLKNYVKCSYQINSYLVSGWDKELGAQIYIVWSFGTILPEKQFAIMGSSQDALAGLAKREYRENMTEDECIKYVEMCVGMGVLLDMFTGGVVRIMICTKKGTRGHLTHPLKVVTCANTGGRRSDKKKENEDDSTFE